MRFPTPTVNSQLLPAPTHRRPANAIPSIETRSSGAGSCVPAPRHVGVAGSQVARATPPPLRHPTGDQVLAQRASAATPTPPPRRTAREPPARLRVLRPGVIISIMQGGS